MNKELKCDKKRRIGNSPNDEFVRPNKNNDAVESLIKDITERVQDAVASSSAFDILNTYSLTCNNKNLDDTAADTSSSVSERKQISGRVVQLKDELRCLHEIKHVIINTIEKEIIQPKLKELCGCLDTYSPLLSLGHAPISHILGFLDEIDLINCEQASYTMNDIAHKKNGTWEQLYMTRRQIDQIIHDDNKTPPMTRDGGMFHDNSDKWWYKSNTFDFKQNLTGRCQQLQPSFGTRQIINNTRIFNSRKFGWLAEKAKMYEERAEYLLLAAEEQYLVCDLNLDDLNHCHAFSGDFDSDLNHGYLRLSYCPIEEPNVIWQGHVHVRVIGGKVKIVIDKVFDHLEKMIHNFQSFRNLTTLHECVLDDFSEEKIPSLIVDKEFQSIRNIMLNKTGDKYGGIPVEQIIQGIQIMSDLKITFLNPINGDCIIATGGFNGDNRFPEMTAWKNDDTLFVVDSKLTRGYSINGSRTPLLELKFNEN